MQPIGQSVLSHTRNSNAATRPLLRACSSVRVEMEGLDSSVHTTGMVRALKSLRQQLSDQPHFSAATSYPPHWEMSSSVSAASGRFEDPAMIPTVQQLVSRVG